MEHTARACDWLEAHVRIQLQSNGKVGVRFQVQVFISGAGRPAFGKAYQRFSIAQALGAVGQIELLKLCAVFNA